MVRSPHYNLRQSRRYANDLVWEYVTSPFSPREGVKAIALPIDISKN
ncbi:MULTISPECIES: hypothetical protein [Moorena]|uniref:Uncharacterized protein n=1 Tax=Moorena producens (strain JHB) TaxID=1454205 RepID=A0A9Q9SU80_MOOP1|nr:MULTISPECIES: hypothetical protein [Moorena]NEQ14564.1 hypothetical protein [Moorena sp. SIO3E2]NER87095.1 hypothetical protein [Moorena sp. SIO3A2]WAN69747.1 hypothetical protein BJP36_37270 [Moorena producens JHB]